MLIREEYTLKPIKSLKKPHLSRSPRTLFSFTRILRLFLMAVHWVMGFCFVRETVLLADILMSDPKHMRTCVKKKLFFIKTQTVLIISLRYEIFQLVLSIVIIPYFPGIIIIAFILSLLKIGI